ncbi:peptidylprolyl isomerase [Rhodoferax sediminis]|uniref:Chaperone SurA n=1 Tax=Rhodoferax sediminis TaxID=2509614 RepID=A0A515DGL3_9BURK|nr:peptidylprolyl isomerase [Rhodoferax sediminis]QDL39566.1 molecular chaperone SurA [Rhodoferax sediminis]
MLQRVLALILAGLMTWMAPPALAQGLRPSPQLGAGSGLLRVPTPRPASSAPRQADYIVAVVNSEPITNNEVQARLKRIEPQLAQQGGPIAPHNVLVRQVLERLITEKAQLQQAKELGLKVDEASVDQAEQNVARQNQVDVATLRTKLAGQGIELKRFRDELRNQILLSRLREREVDPQVKVTDLDVDQFLHEQQGSTDGSGLEINLAQVLVVVPEGASDAQVKALQARAQQVADRARAGDDFAALVNEYSGASRGNGGQMGLRDAARYPALFVEATRNAPIGGVVGPVRSGAGFHILKVIDKQRADMPATVTQSHARHILLRTGAQMSEAQARERLADFRKRILAKQADFATLAREYSQDGSAREGGDLGWSNPGQYVPEFESAMNSLAPGEISEPVTSRFGVHLIQLLERRDVKLTDAQKREVARNILREKKLEEAYATWAQDLRGRAYVEYRDPPQ